MAFETGTATGHTDLYNKLISFLTTNADLVAAGQEWAIAWQAPSGAVNETDIVLRGPGLSGRDQVYVPMRLNQDAPSDAYWLQIRGATGVIPSAEEYTEHVNVTPNYVRMFMDIGTYQYWFVANGRRFMVVLKISTVFEACYAGLFLPYATPLSYPYPLFIGGSAGPEDPQGPTNWRSEADNHRHFVSPHYVASGSTEVDCCAWLLGPAGSWLRASNFGTIGDVVVHPERSWNDFFYSDDNSGSTYNRIGVMTRLMDCYGGDRLLTPFTLIQRSPDTQMLGILDGAYKCQGVANAAENVITQNAIDHLVVQNTFRSNFNVFWAMGMA